MKKILVPVDGSRCSLRGVEYAREIISLNSEIETTLFTVNDVPEDFVKEGLHWVSKDVEGNIIDEACEKENRELFERASNILGDNVKVNFEIGKGKVANEICKYAEENGIDLIIMGTHGRGNIKELFLGSVSQKVLALVSCPVLLVK